MGPPHVWRQWRQVLRAWHRDRLMHLERERVGYLVQRHPYCGGNGHPGGNPQVLGPPDRILWVPPGGPC